MTNKGANHGYDAKNINSIPDQYRCGICKFILKNVMQLACGHRICHPCFPNKNTVFQCPVCSETMPISEIRYDNGCNKDIQTLTIFCSSCEWSGQLRNYQSHLEQIHSQYQCSYCTESFSSLISVNQHQETICRQIPINCILHSYGCKPLRCNLPKHYLSEMHQRILLLCILKFPAMITQKTERSTWFDMHTKREVISLPSNTIPATTTTTTNCLIEKNNTEQIKIMELINILMDGIKVLNEDIQRLSNESLQRSLTIENIMQNLGILKTLCEQSNTNLNAFIINMKVLQQFCFSVKQKVIDSLSISYDGTFIWKIDNVKEKMIDAQSERQTSIYSPSFYSSATGYKICARLYMYGDGNARRTHMSLFFVLMRGENDSLLPFPFQYKIIFCLFDQTSRRQHIIDSFRPDTKSSSFQKPKSDMNIASGIPKFLLLSKIEQDDNPYIKNDTMFIKILIDFENLPNTILPYAFSLNPGLPTHCQHKLIHEEMKRQAQLKS